MRKVVAILGVILFVCSSFTVNSSNMSENVFTNTGNTLYVGGDGPNNYTKIQNAIDNSTNGDTVYVYSGKYAEGVLVDKTIYLMGQDRNTTIIDSTDINDHTVHIALGADGVTVSGFTIKNDEIDPYAVSVYICSDNNIITDNIISNREGIIIEEYSCGNIISNNTIDAWIHGIRLIHSNYNIIHGNIVTNTTDGAINLVQHSSSNSILDNIIIDNKYGMFLLESSHNNTISGNIIDNKYRGICCSRSDHNIICDNIISNNSDGGLLLNFATHHEIYHNTIENNGITGIGVYYSGMNNIYENNFFNNECDASWQNTFLEHMLVPLRNKWDDNYWGRSRVMPKPIFGFIYFGAIGNLPLLLPGFQFDRHPAQEPYDILVGGYT